MTRPPDPPAPDRRRSRRPGPRRWDGTVVERPPVAAPPDPVPAAPQPPGHPEPAAHYPPVYPEPVGPPPERTAWQLLLLPVVAGALVALTLGVYGSVHEGTGVAVSLAGFTDHPAPTSAVKVTLATGALLGALLQLGTALLMYGPGTAAAPWVGGVHRWSGRLAFLLAVPVGVHCLYAAGFQNFTGRVFVHSLLGCLFFGAFVVKMLGLRRDGLPGWFLPLLGGGVFTVLVAVWWTTAVRFFQTFGSPFG